MNTKAEFHGLRVAGPKLVPHNLSPQSSASPQFGDFFKEIYMGRTIESNPRSEFIYFQSSSNTLSHVHLGMAKAKSDFLGCINTHLTHIVKINIDDIPL